MCGGHLHYAEQRLPLAMVLALLRRVAGYLHADIRRQPLNRLREAQVLGLHDEIDDAAVGLTAEAMIETLLFVDREARRLFLMK